MKISALGFAFALQVSFSEANGGCADPLCECQPDESCPKMPNVCDTKSMCCGPVIQTYLTAPFPRSVASSLLPSGLELAPLSWWTDPNTYPIHFIMSEQHNVDAGIPGVSIDYLEFIQALPAVQWDDAHAASNGYRGPFAYWAKSYLDQEPPTIVGQAFGVNKELAHMTQDCNENGSCSYSITERGGRDDGKQILYAEWYPAGSSNGTNTYLPASQVDSAYLFRVLYKGKYNI